MNRRDRLGFEEETVDSQKRLARWTRIGLAARMAMAPLFLIGIMTGCPSSHSKKAINGGESHFLALCPQDCGADLECICGICTKVCENDDDCEEFPSATCVHPALLESARQCEPTDPIEASVCDIGCSDDNECIELDEDATCESGYCRPPEIEKLKEVSDASVLDDAAKDNVGSTESPGGRDAGETGDASETDSADSYSDDPGDKERRLSLISQYCSLIEKYPCLQWNTFLDNYGISINEPIEQQVEDCELSMQLDYYDVAGDCANLWEQELSCHVQRDLVCPCSTESLGTECYAPSMNTVMPGEPCYNETDSFINCMIASESDETVYRYTGERASCDYRMNRFDPGDCTVSCSDDQPNWFYGADCDGPPNGPLSCTCTVMGDRLMDIRRNYSVYGNDCVEVAQALADGRCIEILDCCFTWADENNAQRCGCTSDLRAAIDPPSSVLDPGMTTCEELAGRANGEVVDLCPAYEGLPTDSFL